MSVSKEEILKTASLAKLYLNQTDIKEIYPHMNFIIDMMDKIKKLDNENTDYHSINANQLRKDKTEKSFGKTEILKNSKDTKDGYFSVSKMME